MRARWKIVGGCLLGALIFGCALFETARALPDCDCEDSDALETYCESIGMVAKFPITSHCNPVGAFGFWCTASNCKTY